MVGSLDRASWPSICAGLVESIFVTDDHVHQSLSPLAGSRRERESHSSSRPLVRWVRCGEVHTHVRSKPPFRDDDGSASLVVLRSRERTLFGTVQPMVRQMSVTGSIVRRYICVRIGWSTVVEWIRSRSFVGSGRGAVILLDRSFNYHCDTRIGSGGTKNNPAQSTRDKNGFEIPDGTFRAEGCVSSTS